MQEAMDRNGGSLDDQFLSTVHAWIRKASQDSEQADMVGLLRIVLQSYAGKALANEDTEGASGSLNAFLRADVAEWDVLAAQLADQWSEANLKEELERRMEGVVMSLPSNSYAQKVQAEY